MSHQHDLALLEAQLVVIVGVGVVGSHIARALAQGAIGRLRLIDGDHLEVHNLHRHVLGSEHLISNKALAMAAVLQSVPGLRVEPVPHYVAPEMPDAEVDALLGDADLIVAATDRRAVQRRISARARILDIPALLPGIWATGATEIFVQRSPLHPCYMCWDGWRREQERLREDGVAYHDALSLTPLAVQLARGLLDRNGPDERLLNRSEDLNGWPQLYVMNRFALAIKDVLWRENCPVCGGPPEELESDRAVPPAVAQSWTPPNRPLIDWDDIAQEARNLVVMIVVGIAALALAYGVFRLVVKLIGLLIVELLGGL